MKNFTTSIFILFAFSLHAQITVHIPTPPGPEKSLELGTLVNFKDTAYCLYYNDDENEYHLARFDGKDLYLYPFPDNIYQDGFTQILATENYLMLRYNTTENDKLYQVVGDELIHIPLPTGYDNHGKGVYSRPEHILEHNNEFYLKLRSNDHRDVLHKFNGEDLIEIPSPAGDYAYNEYNTGYRDQPFADGDNIYFRYRHYNGHYTVVKYNGDSLAEIPNSASGYNVSSRGYISNPMKAGDNLFFRFYNSNGEYRLVKYDGDSLSNVPVAAELSNPYDGYMASGIVIDSILYSRFRKSDDSYVLTKCDGDTLIEIPNPNGYSSAHKGFEGTPFVYQNNLYLRYKNNASVFTLHKYDYSQDTLTIVPTPSQFYGAFYGYYGSPIIYNSKMYMRYRSSTDYHLVEFNGSSLTTIENPVDYTGSGHGYHGNPIIHNSNLYLHFRGGTYGNYSTAKFDGDTITIIPNGEGFTGETSLSGVVNGDNRLSIGPNLYQEFRNEESNYTLGYLADATKDSAITACGSYEWIDGNTYFESNHHASHTLSDINGMDSVIISNINILRSDTLIHIITSCIPYTWIDGITYTQDNDTATYILTNSVGCDSVSVLNLDIQSDFTTDTHIACDSFTWMDGNTYTTSNTTATHTLTNAAGCDSVITLDLTILYSNSGTDTQINCGPYNWIDGNTYTESNSTASLTFQNVNGCDSVVTLDLTILNPSTGTDPHTACDSLVWIDGNTYTASNTTATHILSNAVGCDSLVTLDLTILNSSTGTDPHTACDSFTWIDGNTYTASNTTATHILSNAAGCDSVVTLDLTILESTSSNLNFSEQDSLVWNGLVFTQSTDTSITIVNSAGCDSVVNISLVILPSVIAHNQSFTICDGDSIEVGNSVYTQEGTYIDTLMGANNDSIVTTTIVINGSIPTPSISQPFVLTLETEQGYSAYQWKLDGNDISGANSYQLNITQGGSYNVVVETSEGCEGVSDPYNVATNSIEQASAGITLYPNPTKNTVIIESEKMGTYKVLNAYGKLILQGEKTSLNQKIDLSPFAKGIYLVRFNQKAFQLIKQ